MFIPESRKRPITESLLYKQIVRFLQYEKLEDKFEITFISIADGVVEAKKSETLDYRESNVALPPKRFRSGRSWISQEQIKQMADNIVSHLSLRGARNERRGNPIVIAYARGSYLEAVRLANKELKIQNSWLEIKEIFSEDELANLKKKGVMWMKVGLRMPEAFTIFQKRIVEFAQDIKQDNKPRTRSFGSVRGRQLTLF